jgi:hypothetical protein
MLVQGKKIPCGKSWRNCPGNFFGADDCKVHRGDTQQNRYLTYEKAEVRMMILLKLQI